jgi:two-component system, NtrC family, nitrogen regulation sensor histidine kinase NtrY
VVPDRQSPRRRWPSPTAWASWAVAAGAALLIASQWLHGPSVEYLVPLVVATLAALWFAFAIRGAERWWAVGCSFALAAAAALAVPAERNLWLVQHRWDVWRHDAVVHGLASLGHQIDEAAAAAGRAADRALAVAGDTTDDRSRAFDQLSRVVGGGDERGVVVYRADSALAWAGIIRPPIDKLHDGVTVIGTPFYLALQTSRRRGDERAVAVALIDAAPPADELSASVAHRVAIETNLGRFVFGPPTDSASGPEVLRYSSGGVSLFDVRSDTLMQGQVEQRISEAVRARAGVAFIVALACFIIGVWRGTRSLTERLAALAVGLACTALVPTNQYSNLTRLFDPAVYFTPQGGPLTGNAGALATTGALVLLGVFAVFRRRARRVPWWTAAAIVLLVAGLGPFLLRDLARGVTIPLRGVDSPLWLIWEIPLFLAAVPVLLAGAAAGASLLGPRRGVPPWVAPLAAAVAAVIAPVVWDAPGRWPWWYTILWVVAIGILALSRRTRWVILSASTVAALGATTLVWGRTARGRVEAADRDLAGLSQPDFLAMTLLRRLGMTLGASDAPTTREALLQAYVTSDIAAAGNPIALYAWPTDSAPTARFATADIPIPFAQMASAVSRARQARILILEPVPTDTALEVVMAAPDSAHGVTAAIVAPKSRLFAPDPFVRFLGIDVDPTIEPPYTVRLRSGVTNAPPEQQATWRREASELHGDWTVRTGTGSVPAHVEVELRSPGALVPRGALIVLLDLAIVAVIWLASVVADGGAGRLFRARRRTWGRSYRARLSLALFAFFVLPAITFAIWSYGQLAADATQSRAVLVSETLRALVPPDSELWLPGESSRLDTPLFLYRGGELSEASDPLYDELAPTGRLLPPAVEISLAERDEETATETHRVGDVTALFGYRAFEEPRRPLDVVATPARADELSLGRRRRDLGILVLFATAVGALAALWLSGIAARQLARPIRTLREAALAIASGARVPPLEDRPTVEFHPVFAAFRQMASDLNASRTALEQAQRRTAAVLRNVASGVVAVDEDCRVALANPRAEALLGGSLAPGTPFAQRAPTPIAQVVERFLKSDRDEEEFESSVDAQQVRGTLTRLARGGAVVTLDDVTEIARAQRVLAWGEMARQVAHEIKNPLTPIRLGVQHLRRARADARVDFDRVLEHNVNQILTEIDRLDEIARAFSRYGAAPEERRPAEAIDVAAVVREVVSLERLGGDADAGLEWTEQGVDAPIVAHARADELKEVLLNVLENARHAAAKHVNVRMSVVPNDAADAERRALIEIHDDGHGIPAAVLPRIFEPHFSTRTSGSGLGLAISRQIVERWTGDISVESESGIGTTVTIALRLA